MNPTAFAHPEWAAVPAAVVAAAALAVLLARQRARRRNARLFPGGPPPLLRGLAGDAALVAALLSISVALVGPRIGTRTVAFPSAGVDVVFLVDVSRSQDLIDLLRSQPTALADVLQVLERAAGDTRVHGVLLRVGDALGWAQLATLERALERPELLADQGRLASMELQFARKKLASKQRRIVRD